jgi:hypothetical protein
LHSSLRLSAHKLRKSPAIVKEKGSPLRHFEARCVLALKSLTFEDGYCIFEKFYLSHLQNTLHLRLLCHFVSQMTIIKAFCRFVPGGVLAFLDFVSD